MPDHNIKESMTKKEILTLALLIAVMPPAWAVLSPYMGISVGPVALICAGIYATNGNKFKDAHKIALGYLAGDIWALIAFEIMAHTPINPDLTLFLTLAVFGFILVIISARFANIINMPSWLTGWAIGMLAMNLNTSTPVMSLTVQIGIAMLAGVYYVGALLDKVHRLLNK